MAECAEISMMLGAFEDSELEPNEMQEVAFHLARCESCTGILADYSTLGRDLRSITAEPSLAGFSRAVIARVDRLPQPVQTQNRALHQASDRFRRCGYRMGRRGRASAIVTIILMTPYARAVRQSRDAVDRDRQGGGSTPPPRQIKWPTRRPMSRRWRIMILMPTFRDSSRRIDSVAVWSEPRRDTTVIWLPDQP